MRVVVDRLHPNDRTRFFDELPEEAWNRLMDELSGALGVESAGAAESKEAIEEQLAPAEAIIEAHQIQKSFRQPDGVEIQVIAPMDLSIEANTICALLGPSGSGKSTLLRMGLLMFSTASNTHS
jgi:ABC-type glutathione transport system ATPase component